MTDGQGTGWTGEGGPGLGRRPHPDFLGTSPVVNWNHPPIRALAASLRASTNAATAARCFEWVRDQIQHCVDFRREELPCVASDVLAVGTGLCVAKSHLLVALLRANGVPSGFCYQRLAVGTDGPPFCVHGLVAVWLEPDGWYRCDARGNRPGIACAFTPGRERLAFETSLPGECVYPGVWAAPWPALIDAMQRLTSTSAYLASPIDVAPPASGVREAIL